MTNTNNKTNYLPTEMMREIMSNLDETKKLKAEIEKLKAENEKLKVLADQVLYCCHCGRGIVRDSQDHDECLQNDDGIWCEECHDHYPREDESEEEEA